MPDGLVGIAQQLAAPTPLLREQLSNLVAEHRELDQQIVGDVRERFRAHAAMRHGA